MKNIVVFALFITTTIFSQDKLKDLSFLEGNWKVENKETYEAWNIVSENHLKGESYKIKNGSKEISEYLEIMPSKNKIIYTATVLNQNDGKGVNFKLKKIDKNTYSFENPNHDFPQKIIYKKIKDNEIFVQVLGKDDKGFSYKMAKHSKPKTIPNWFTKDLKANIGTWIADNSIHKSEKEPYTAYGLEWKWGIGNTAIVGRLYGIIDGKEIGDFWKFRQYWDNLSDKAVFEQFGYNGVIGIGTRKPTEDNLMETIQTFSLPDGRKWIEKHLTKMNETEFTGTSYDKGENNSWHKKRSYTWVKQSLNKNTELSLGSFSISLVVKDINASKVFYEKLGFTKMDGNVKQKWLILKNGNSKVGLFQGMFPKNTITFNPNDVRKLYATVKAKKIDVQMANGMDKKEGKASFMITDPDGNPILIDQHE